VSLKRLDCSAGKMWNLLNCWVSVGVASLMHRIKGRSQPYFSGLKKRSPDLDLISDAMGARLIIFRLRDGLESLGPSSTKATRFETTFRIGLKGGLNLFAAQGAKICVTSLHFDGHEHLNRNVDLKRIVNLIHPLSSGVTIHSDVTLDDRSSNHDKKGVCQSYDDCQLLQLTDIFVSGFRTVLGEAKCEAQRLVSEPFAILAREWNKGPARMKNSRWHGGICLSEAYLEDGQWKFADLRPKIEDTQQKLLYPQDLLPQAGQRVMIESTLMGKYQKGDHVKFEVNDEGSGKSEWLWLLVESSDDGQEIVFGKLDSEPIVATEMRVGQELAVSYEKVRDHRSYD
jgi:hypothetical protein